jgi:hypothetical protein
VGGHVVEAELVVDYEHELLQPFLQHARDRVNANANDIDNDNRSQS